MNNLNQKILIETVNVETWLVEPPPFVPAGIQEGQGDRIEREDRTPNTGPQYWCTNQPIF